MEFRAFGFATECLGRFPPRRTPILEAWPRVEKQSGAWPRLWVPVVTVECIKAEKVHFDQSHQSLPEPARERRESCMSGTSDLLRKEANGLYRLPKLDGFVKPQRD